MRRASLLTAVAVVAATPAVAGRDAAQHDFDLRPGLLRDVIAALGRQGQVIVAVADPALGTLPLRGVRGRMTAARALDRLLAGTAARAIRVEVETFRIVAHAPARASRPAAPPAPAPAPPVDGGEVIVTASKRAAPLDRYPGSVAILRADELAAGGPQGTAAIVERLPVLGSTHLGPGRDKLFIRGIADSSFTGRSQATVGQYLGEVRLNYAAPDPHLELYDLRGVEVLEGPQGTLYGAGSLGGILRLEPNPPDLSRATLTAGGGGRLVAHGGPGGDGFAVANLPLVRDRVAARVVAYGGSLGGYIDDPARGRRDLNRTDTRGLRATVRWQAGAWTIDGGLVRQDINSRDGQYAFADLPPLQRTQAMAQPFDNDYLLYSVTVRRALGDMQLVSATAAVRHVLDTEYDATLDPAAPRLFRERNRSLLWASEMRLSRAGTRVDWVAGIELLRSSERIARALGPPAAPPPTTGSVSIVREASVFGEATWRVRPRLAITAGARAVGNVRTDETFDDEVLALEPRRRDRSLLPTLALLWTPTPRLDVYARIQRGFRPGGLVATEGAAQRFESDSIRTLDLGFRLRSAAVTLGGGLSHSRWEDIQSDLVTDAGFPVVANVGDGRVLGVQFDGEWRPTRTLRLQAAGFVNRSRLTDPQPGFDGRRGMSLPNVAGRIARLAALYDRPLGTAMLGARVAARYVGRSRLGVGALADRRQGGYLDTEAGVVLRRGATSLSLDVTNLFDARGNLFAFGNPFALATRRQVTPQVPRAVRLGWLHSF